MPFSAALRGAAISSPSLTGRLLRGMILPMAGFAILLGVGGSWAIEESVEAVNDRILSAASRAISEALAVEDGEISLDLPASAFAMLENAERDNVYYSISHKGAVISGYADLPVVNPAPMNEGEVRFAKADYRGRQIRLVAEVRRLSRVDGLVTVQVAETMSARNRVARQMLLSLALLEGLLIALSAILIPVAVRWGLAPLLQIRDEMDQRRASDFTPLPQEKVPAELRDLVRAFNGLLSRLDNAVEGMRRFTADASHQMRTPLSILRAHVAVLRKAQPGSVEARHSIEDIEHATTRLQNLVVKLLALARADSAQPKQETFTSLNLVELARRVANEQAGLALKKKAVLQFDASQETIFAPTQETLAEELLGNLLTNAITYNDRGGIVHIEVLERQGHPVVVIEDDGPGIPVVDREKVFERFTRLHPDRDRAGTGLGMSIVKALADAIGATVYLRDGELTKGLRVEVLFPTGKAN